MSVKQPKLPRGFVDPRKAAGLVADAPVAVAFSGGADSVALLAMLADTPVRAVHVHHGIRGAEADRDAAFAEQIAARLGVPFTLLFVDVPKLAAERGQGMETVARDARYGVIAAFMKRAGIPLLVTAHHADDQLETLLQNLLRGSGTRGLSGIPALRPLGEGLLVARPLLQVEKQELLAYLTHRELPYVTDSTNEEPCCPRNILRREVLPLLKQLQPGAAVAAARCAEALAADEAYLDGLAADFLEKEGDAPSIAALAALPRPLFARVVRRLLPVVPAACHVEALWELVRVGKPHAALSLPGARVVIAGGKLRQSPPEEAVADYCLPLSAGETVVPGVGVVYLQEAVGELPPPPTPPTDFAHTARILLDASLIKGRLSVRCRRPGDRILHGGMHRAIRRLPELLTLSPACRARMPLVVDEAGILAVPGGPVRDPKPRKIDTVIDLFFN